MRWVVPVGVVGAVGLAAGGMITAKATPDRLPRTTTTALLSDVQAASVSGFSGTIVAQLSLGLPSLPGIAGAGSGSGGSGSGEASVGALLSGSHTMRLWYGGADRQRLALLGVTSETDVFHLGRDLWQWDSETHVATHTALPAMPAAVPAIPAIPFPSATGSLTPQQLAALALEAIHPSTVVTLGANRVVADRSVYELVLTPRDPASRVGSVRIAVDGDTKLPLGVQVFARGAGSPAIDVAFSSVSFKTPSAGYFRFTPPPGATVRNEAAPAVTRAPAGRPALTTMGSGWTSIAEYRATPRELASLGRGALTALPRVSGAWGQGRLLESALFCALIADDGRVYVGAVDPPALYAAAAAHR